MAFKTLSLNAKNRHSDKTLQPIITYPETAQRKLSVINRWVLDHYSHRRYIRTGLAPSRTNSKYSKLRTLKPRQKQDKNLSTKKYSTYSIREIKATDRKKNRRLNTKMNSGGVASGMCEEGACNSRSNKSLRGHEERREIGRAHV